MKEVNLFCGFKYVCCFSVRFLVIGYDFKEYIFIRIIIVKKCYIDMVSIRYYRFIKRCFWSLVYIVMVGLIFVIEYKLVLN